MKTIKNIAILIALFQIAFPLKALCVSPEIKEKIIKLQGIYEKRELKNAENLALEILRDIKNEKNIDVLQLTAILNKLNGIYKKTGDFDKALKYIKEACLLAKKDSAVPKHASALYTCNLAATYELMGNDKNAMIYYEESVDNFIKLLGSKERLDRDSAHLFLPKVTDDLLKIYHKLGMKDKIEQLNRKIDNTLLNAPL